MSRPIDANEFAEVVREMDNPDITDILMALGEMPTIKVDRPKGKWLYDRDHGLVCNQCGHKAHIHEYAQYAPVYEPTDFCPHCGADMRRSR